MHLKSVFHVRDQIILFRIKIIYNLKNQFLQYVRLKSIWLWTKERNFDTVDLIVMGTLIHFLFVWKNELYDEIISRERTMIGVVRDLGIEIPNEETILRIYIQCNESNGFINGSKLSSMNHRFN